MAFFTVCFLGVETVQAKIEAKLASRGASNLCVSQVTHKEKLLEEGTPMSNYGVTDADLFVFVLSPK